MENQEVNVGRRSFAKGVGIGLASLPLVAPGIAGAFSQKYTKDEFESLSVIPQKGLESIFLFGKRSVRLYKNIKDLEINKFLELHGVAAVVAQSCTGRMNDEEIVDLVSKVYRIDKSVMIDKVNSFIKYLFEKGYINYISAEQKQSNCKSKKGKGLYCLGRNDLTFKVVENNINFEF